MRPNFPVRAFIATLLSPVAAAFFVSILLVCLAAQNEFPREGGLFVALQLVPAILLFTYAGTVFAGVFSVLFALLTQVPLAWIYSRRGSLSLFGHFGISAALGALLFPTLYPFVERLQGSEGSLSFVADKGVVLTALIGAMGGAGVGLLWHRVLLRCLSRPTTISATA